MNNSSELLDHEHFLIFGAARSGLAAARLLVSLGKQVGIYDEASPDKLEKARQQAEELGIPLFTDICQAGFPNGWQVLVLSPGSPTTHSLVVLAEECGCVVRSEIEIAYLARRAPL
ncbi:MAG: hypothetical protein MUQ56_10905, partial [Thermoleophilia bacterium]|nr:hypothetical protein [Thermoleophilia bacterium]